ARGRAATARSAAFRETNSTTNEETALTANPTRFVIIGNGAAGTYAAEQLRKLDAAAEIVMIDDEPYTLYNRVSLPRYLRGVLLEQRVYVRDMEWHTTNRIDLRLETKVDQVSFDEKTLHMEPGGELAYDKLLIATGGRPPPLRRGDREAGPLARTAEGHGHEGFQRDRGHGRRRTRSHDEHRDLPGDRPRDERWDPHK